MQMWKLSLATIFLSLFLVFLSSSSLLPKSSSPDFIKNAFTITGTYDESKTQATFLDKTFQIPTQPTVEAVLGEQSNTGFGKMIGSNKRIYVDLTNQRLYAYEGDKMVYNFLVSTGKWGRTPTGKFKIWIKLRYTLMSGGSQELGTYYYLPNVPFTMFFYNDEVPQYVGYGIHGTYWHDNFGHPMSHGCVNMRNEDVEKLYYWAGPDLQGKESIKATDDNPGTEIIIYGEAPLE
ncbi:L,D-transpeptidase [Candidatus Beckwithbacteria bacterium]|nr:L,D-transpeptidase [Candidatus Beckwithbacteria bacterium]